MKRLIFIAPLVILAAIIVAFAAGLQRDPAILPSQLLDQPLPAFALASVEPGQAGFGSATLRGRPMLLNVWASWCAACKVEHPELLAMNAAGVPIFGLVWKDQAAAAVAVLTTSGNPYRATADDADGRTGINLGVTGAPETFVVDAHGRVRYKQVGPITRDVWLNTLSPLLTKLRAEA